MTHRPFLSFALTTALAASLLASTSATAERGRERWRDAMPDNFAPAQSASKRIGIEEATRRAMRHTPGRVLNARERGDVFEIKMLTPRNEVVTVTVDALSGEILR